MATQTGASFTAEATPSTAPFEVVVAGAGVAGIEAAIAITERAPGLTHLTLLAPNDQFRFRPGLVLEPFGYPPGQGVALTRIAAALGADLVSDRLAWVDTPRRIVHSKGGTQLRFDALALCLGASARPRFEHAITIGEPASDELGVLLADIRGGRVTKLAFVVPERMAWPLPLYEFALMCAARVAGDRPELQITFLTSESAPLRIFGKQAGRRVSALMEERGIELVCSAHCEVPSDGEIVVDRHAHAAGHEPSGRTDGPRRVSADRIISLPELFGPHVRGLPTSRNGFIPVDRYCRVRGAERVYAAGDGTDFAIKHGGIAAQQADVAADSIAALAGAPLRPGPFHPTIHGMLLTGGDPWFLSAHLIGGHAFGSELSATAAWNPPSKVAAKYLGPFLERLRS